MARERLACLIVARNLGDAVIQSGVLKKIIQRDYAERYIVWCRPQVAFLFKDLEQTETVCSQFPVGTSKQFGWDALILFINAVKKIRSLNPSVSLDLIGDFRERAFARLLGTDCHRHIGWQSGHPFLSLIRNPLGQGSPFYIAPAAVCNIYSAYDRFVDTLAGEEIGFIKPATPCGSSRMEGKKRVGLHPFASLDCKLWPKERWLDLAENLIENSYEVTAFGSPSERAELVSIFDRVKDKIEFVTVDLQQFGKVVSCLDLLIGLDSFSVHMAERMGVKSVMINAGNDPVIWAPPGAVVLGSSGGCRNYPCFNKPRCRRGQNRFACINSISVEMVAGVAKEMLG